MDILLFLLIGQLLLVGNFASDKQLKEDPKTKQAIIADNENVTECAGIGPDTVLSAEIYNNSRAPETFVTNGMSSDNSGEPETSVTNEMSSDNLDEPETSVTNEMSSDNPGEPETSVTNEMSSDNPGEPETSVTNEMSSDNPGEPETSVTNEMSSDNPGEPETSVTNEMSSDNSDEPETSVTNEMSSDNSGEPETSVTNEMTSDNPGEPETSVNNEMSSDNSGEPETLVFNEMSSDNSGEPETLVSNEMDREHSANDDSPDKEMHTDLSRIEMEGVHQSQLDPDVAADDNDHCSSNPCKNEGTCIEEGDDYSCKCAYHWYSGKDCDKDDGPCETFCSERGTARCVYSGPGGTVTSCVCNAGYEGDKCDYFHDCAKNSLLTPLINICIERRMTNEECIRNATGIDKSVDSLDELVKRIDNGDIQIPTIEDNLRIFFGDLDLFDLLFQKFGLGKLVSGSEGFIDNVVLGLIKEFGFVKLMSDIEGLAKLMSGIEGFKDYVHRGPGKEYGFHNLMPVIEGYKQQLQRQHQHSGDDGVVEVTEKYKKKFASL